MKTLQVFSVKIAERAQGLPWPLHVFGMVVARDVLDRNRNVIFHRTRDDCQTITAEVFLTHRGYLALSPHLMIELNIMQWCRQDENVQVCGVQSVPSHLGLIGLS
jgi:hypothetical protein